MQAAFLFGPAGSGKTFRCLREIRLALKAAPEGLPLVFLAPKQATFQLERELLADPEIPGFTRLKVVSFDALAELVLAQFFLQHPRVLSEEGRLMVLRALLAQRCDELKLFPGTARLPGFARQLSVLLGELQRHRVTADDLAALAERARDTGQLPAKLHDVAFLLRAYLDWLQQNDLEDPHSLLHLAAETVREAARLGEFRLGGLWLDGFADITPQELDFLSALLGGCEQATLAFCLPEPPRRDVSWFSVWSATAQTVRRCQEHLQALPGCQVTVETLRRGAGGRFGGNAVLAHLERHWAEPKPFANDELAPPGGASVPASQPSPGETSVPASQSSPGGASVPASRVRPEPDPTTWHHDSTSAVPSAVRLVECPNPEAEAVVAAREILQFVRERGGRFRDTAVLVRSLDNYHAVIRRVFGRYGIPFFLDRREPIAHHPLAELTRYALRTVVHNWEHTDWFGALKTGLVHPNDPDIDRLENAALARGWRGSVWLHPLRLEREPDLAKRLEALRREIVPPFSRFAEAMGAVLRQPTGTQLAAALRALWAELGVPETLRQWSEAAAGAAPDARDAILQSAIHEVAGEEMSRWLDNLEMAFARTPLPLGDWMAVVEAGLANLTVGVVPPALDQVVVGAVDRSRNPNLELALVLGLNETVFPAAPTPGILLTDYDREILAQAGLGIAPGQKQQIGRERFWGYIACTRARRRLVLTFAQRDANDVPLNPSPFIGQLQQLFPGLEPAFAGGPADWRESQQAHELLVPLLRQRTAASPPPDSALAAFASLPALAPVLARGEQLAAGRGRPRLAPGLAERLYGPRLETSISALEDYAACPFRFFVVRGLRAEERQEFEADPRERGSFQHEVLKNFHLRLRELRLRWRELDPARARALIGEVGEATQRTFRDGLFLSTPDRRFAARTLIEGLQRLIEVFVGWAPRCAFEPEVVELDFGLGDGGLEPWRLDLGDGHVLQLRGRIDRVDVHRADGAAHLVVIDYKSSGQELERVKLQHGLDLQLLAYLGVLRAAANAPALLGVDKLVPAGAFYVSLRGAGGTGRSRAEVLAEREAARRAGYQHRGRFRGDQLEWFDNRGDARGEQFRYARNKDGSFSKVGNEALDAAEFLDLVRQNENFLREYGREIYAGDVRVAPYRLKAETACDHCHYRAVCRFDPWTDPYRTLKPAAPTPTPAGGEEAAP